MATDGSTITREAFLSQLEALVAEHDRAPPNIGCLQSEECVDCADCVFCRGCERCHSARYSIGCHESFDITHCVSCSHCYGCTFCKHSRHCSHSNYLLYCVGCTACDYCFGCVGLEKQHFHILNRKYSRKEYFRIVKELERVLEDLVGHPMGRD